jgi:hypothetical protein
MNDGMLPIVVRKKRAVNIASGFHGKANASMGSRSAGDTLSTMQSDSPVKEHSVGHWREVYGSFDSMTELGISGTMISGSVNSAAIADLQRKVSGACSPARATGGSDG